MVIWPRGWHSMSNQLLSSVPGHRPTRFTSAFYKNTSELKSWRLPTLNSSCSGQEHKRNAENDGCGGNDLPLLHFTHYIYNKCSNDKPKRWAEVPNGVTLILLFLSCIICNDKIITDEFVRFDTRKRKCQQCLYKSSQRGLSTSYIRPWLEMATPNIWSIMVERKCLPTSLHTRIKLQIK
jgi:hypothetical protein